MKTVAWEFETYCVSNFLRNARSQAISSLHDLLRSVSISGKRKPSFSAICILALATFLGGARTLASQSLPTYSAYDSIWIDNYYTVNGAEVDSGSCIGTPRASGGFPLSSVMNQVSFQEEYPDAGVRDSFFPLHTQGQGSWTPSSATFYGTPTLGPESDPENPYTLLWYLLRNSTSKFQLTLSGAGVITAIEIGTQNVNASQFGEYYQLTGRETWSGKETINLNTGNDQWEFKANFSGENTFPGGSCSVQASFSGTYNYVIGINLLPALNSTLNNLNFVNPAADIDGIVLPLPEAVDKNRVPFAPAASALSADGKSAAAVVYQSDSPDAVAFVLSASGSTESTPVGSITAFEPSYLFSPAPGSAEQVHNIKPINPGCGSAGDGSPCTFLALVWAPDGMPDAPADSAPLDLPDVSLNVQATQDSSSSEGSIDLQPPPVVLVHGIWSSAVAAWSGLLPWLQANYDNNGLISTADYGMYSSLTFKGEDTQKILESAFADALDEAANSGVVARQVDVVAHSMGGLATRYLMDHPGPDPLLPPDYLPKEVVHKLITIGTPHQGTELASVLWDLRYQPKNSSSFLDFTLCNLVYLVAPCTPVNLFKAMGKSIDTAVESLQLGYPSSQPYIGIQAQRPANSLTLNFLNSVIGGFTRGNTVDDILKSPENDTIVPGPSQIVGALDKSLIPNAVHTTLPFSGLEGDVGETSSQAIWNQALYWLMGGKGQYIGRGISSDLRHADAVKTSVARPPDPVFDLDTFTQVPSSNVTITPASGSSLMVGAETIITAKSTTKTISEFLLFQKVQDPVDDLVLFSTLSPFTIPYTPARFGSASFGAIAVFTDKTMAIVPLSYTLTPPGPTTLTMAAPSGSLYIGASATVPVMAMLGSQSVDVTNAATFKARSGSDKVFSVGEGGLITAIGNGNDWLDASYGGRTASAQITVGGACTYALHPPQLLLGYPSGKGQIQVETQNGCSWTADNGGQGWLKFSPVSGSGSGLITVSATDNNSGYVSGAAITVAGQNAVVFLPNQGCPNTVDTGNIQLPGIGGSGFFYAYSFPCPVIVKSSASWLAAVYGPTDVYYGALPNLANSSRSATLTVGAKVITVTEAPIAAAAAPGFSISAGTYTVPQTVALSDSTPGAVLYYTTDGIAPTTASAIYKSPLRVAVTETIRAIAVARDYLPSHASSTTYTIAPLAATPAIFPRGGTYTKTQAVTITDATANATLYYTLDGSSPTNKSPKYSHPVTVSQSSVLQAIATAPFHTQSDLAQAVYEINLPTAATPIFNPGQGSFLAGQKLTMSDATPRSSIHFTTNGDAPTAASKLYTAPITVATTELIQAIAVATNYDPSNVASATYTIVLPLAATPVLTPAGGTFATAQKVTMSDTTPGAIIEYSINGSSGTKYSGPIVVSATSTIQAIAQASGHQQSAVATATYVIGDSAAAAPVISLPSGSYNSVQTVSITGTGAAVLYYTTNGTAPSAASTKYTAPIKVAGTEILNAIAIAGGDAPSPIATATYGIQALPIPVITTAVSGSTDGFFPGGVTFDSSGDLYVSDIAYCVVWKITSTGVKTPFVGTPGSCGYLGDGGLATKAQLNQPAGIAFDTAGELYIADTQNAVIRVVSAKTNVISTVGATNGVLSAPNGIALDTAGNVYIADSDNEEIYEYVTATRELNIVAGSGSQGYSGDGGQATDAELSGPKGVAVDSEGNLYIADTSNSVIRKVASSGLITTVAGSGVSGYSGNGGPAKSAKLTYPYSVLTDSSGDIYFTDTGNNVVREIVAQTGVIQDVAGNGFGAGTLGAKGGLTGDYGPASKAELDFPLGIALDNASNLYISDFFNYRVRKVTF